MKPPTENEALAVNCCLPPAIRQREKGWKSLLVRGIRLGCFSGRPGQTELDAVPSSQSLVTECGEIRRKGKEWNMGLDKGGSPLLIFLPPVNAGWSYPSATTKMLSCGLHSRRNASPCEGGYSGLSKSSHRVLIRKPLYSIYNECPDAADPEATVEQANAAFPIALPCNLESTFSFGWAGRR